MADHQDWQRSAQGSETASFEDRLSRLAAMLESPTGSPERDEWMGGHESEADAAYAMVGSWLSGKARSINQGLREAPIADRKARAELAGQAKELFSTLAELSGAMQADSFDAFATRGLGFTEGEAAFLNSEIESLRDFSNALALPLASEDAGEARFGAMRESPSWRQAVKNGGGRKFDESSFFAPLLECISKESSATLRAEMTAKMELYIQSGHARRDCLEVHEGSTKAAEGMRELCERLRADPDSGKDAMKAVNARFGELFLKVSVEQQVDEQGEVTSVARHLGQSKSASGRSAETGTIDAVIRDARDSSRLHAAVVTADESTFIESDQVFRHRKAIVDAVKNGEIPGAKEVAIAFYAPCLFYDKANEKGRELGESFLSSMKDRLTPDERQNLNALPFLSAIARVDRNHPNFPVESLADYDLRLIGASSTQWNESMAKAREAKDPVQKREAFLEAVAGHLSGAIDVFSKKNPDESKLRAGNSNRTLLGSFCECLEGLNKHGIEKPELLAPIERNIPRLKALRAHLGKESEIRGRLAGVIDAFDYPGGVRAWAAKRVASESEENDLARRMREEQLTEAAANKAMVQSFVEELGSKGSLGRSDIKALKLALREDSSMVLGFSDADRREIEQQLDLDPATARARVRGRATEALPEAAGRGDIQTLHRLVRHGADLSMLDARGRDPLTIAKGAGHADAAAYIEVAREKQCVEQMLARERADRKQLSIDQAAGKAAHA